MAGVPASIAARTRIVRQDRSEGYIVGRNTIMRLAGTEYVLLLDDDAYLLDRRSGLVEALALMEQHAEVAAIGCAQAEADGTAVAGGHAARSGLPPLPRAVVHRLRASSSAADLPRDRRLSRGASFLRRRERIFCARLLRAGYHVVYLPDLLVAHVPDPGGRSTARYLRYVVSNDCLFALYNLPWPAMCVSLPVRLARYFSMRSAILGERSRRIRLDCRRSSSAPCRASCETRTPMSWSNVSEWRRLRRDAPPWPA